MSQLIKKMSIMLIVILTAFAVIACDSKSSNDDDEDQNSTDFVNEGTATAPVAITLGTAYTGQVSDGNKTDVCLKSYYEVAITPAKTCTITMSGIDEFDDDQNTIDFVVRDKKETDPNIVLKFSSIDTNGNQYASLSATETANISALIIRVDHCTNDGPGGDFTLLVQQ